LKYLDIDGRIILKWVSRHRVLRLGTDLSGSGSEKVTDSCQHGNEISGFTNKREYILTTNSFSRKVIFLLLSRINLVSVSKLI
jgi:hypothetical protein